MQKLLSRNEFRESVFARDGHRCVFCGAKAGETKLDAHHIYERRLWTDPTQFGGYFLDNGVTLCDRGYDRNEQGNYSCHMQAGMTLISPQECRDRAGIKKIILPNHLYEDQEYSVWGDIILPNKQRMKGELFDDESVQHMLKLGGVLQLYTDYVKHPRTYHLPFSPKVLNNDLGDDRVMETLDRFQGQRVIATVKMDGGQNTLYQDYLHARTIDFQSDETLHWLQNWHAKFQYEIPKGYRVNVENLYITHDIHYENLPLYVMGWMMWDDKNYCLSWDETQEWFALFNESLKQVNSSFATVPVLYDGIWNENIIKKLYQPNYHGDQMEGFVVRLADKFHYRDFRHCVGKYVRGEHNPKHGNIYVKNKIRSG